MHRSAAVLLLLNFVAVSQLNADSPFSNIAALTAELSKITGLKPLKSVQYDTISRTDLKAFLDRRVKQELRPEEIKIEELALKKLGLVPRDFELAPTMVALMAEQAEAFYDYRKKKLFLVQAEQGAGPMQEAALLHELAHALADQHFKLEKFIKHGKSDDSSLARTAVMEGQATWIMYEWMAAKAGQSLRKMPALAEMVGRRSDAMTAQYPVLSAAPLYLRATLLFPYGEGLRFQQAVIEKLGDEGFSSVFRYPPVSSQQILHPDKYFGHVMPVALKPPALARSSDYKELLEGTVGEFDHSILLEQYADGETARRLSPEWRGGVMRVAEHKQDKRSVMTYASEWATAEAARQFFSCYKKIISGKSKQVSYVRDVEDVLEGTTEDGAFRVTLDGNRVTSVEGLRDRSELADTAAAGGLH